jgi:hypothetical protein
LKRCSESGGAFARRPIARLFCDVTTAIACSRPVALPNNSYGAILEAEFGIQLIAD